jgi:hypothetical protein
VALMGAFNIGNIGGLFQRAVPAQVRRNLGPFLGFDKASVGLSGLLYGSDLVRQATDSLGITPSAQDFRRKLEGRAKIGKNYTVNGIEYDFRTGRPINPPQSVFTPAAPTPPSFEGLGSQAGQQTAQPPAFSGSRGMSNGAGVPALRQNVQERALSQEVLNAAQQYSAPSSIPLPSFYQGQQQLGRSMEQTGELQRQLQELGGAAGMSNDALMQWAQANPGLAYRELQKLKSRSSQ